jgi:hypothetical protein
MIDYASREEDKADDQLSEVPCRSDLGPEDHAVFEWMSRFPTKRSSSFSTLCLVTESSISVHIEQEHQESWVPIVLLSCK